ncbi:MAG: hypothetical protein ABIO72_03450 [Patescibacteria group bacterium]
MAAQWRVQVDPPGEGHQAELSCLVGYQLVGQKMQTRTTAVIDPLGGDMVFYLAVQESGLLLNEEIHRSIEQLTQRSTITEVIATYWAGINGKVPPLPREVSFTSRPWRLFRNRDGNEQLGLEVSACLTAFLGGGATSEEIPVRAILTIGTEPVGSGTLVTLGLFSGLFSRLDLRPNSKVGWIQLR